MSKAILDVDDNVSRSMTRKTERGWSVLVTRAALVDACRNYRFLQSRGGARNIGGLLCHL